MVFVDQFMAGAALVGGGDDFAIFIAGEFDAGRENGGAPFPFSLFYLTHSQKGIPKSPTQNSV
jgi:hypothetical protein